MTWRAGSGSLGTSRRGRTGAAATTATRKLGTAEGHVSALTGVWAAGAGVAGAAGICVTVTFYLFSGGGHCVV